MKQGDKYFIIIIFSFIVLFFYFKTVNNNKKKVKIYINNKLVKVINKKGIYIIKKDGVYFKFSYDKRITILETNCPKKICQKMSRSKFCNNIVCVPNKTVFKYVESSDNEFDGIAR